MCSGSFLHVVDHNHVKRNVFDLVEFQPELLPERHNTSVRLKVE
jgi:hypothetical protein